jgi:hypothetical protein
MAAAGPGFIFPSQPRKAVPRMERRAMPVHERHWTVKLEVGRDKKEESR